jgi:hypothetical protein
MMNEMLQDLINQGIIIYIDNSLIYLEEEIEHHYLVMEVLQPLN